MYIRDTSAVNALKATDLNILADGQDLLLQQLGNGHLRAFRLQSKQSLYVGGRLVENGQRAGLDKSLKISVLRDKVGLGIDLDHNTCGVVVIGDCQGNTLGSNAVSLLSLLRQALLS